MLTYKLDYYPDIWEIRGLSTDKKPKRKEIGNGSSFFEMDTGKVFIYNAPKKEWKELSNGSGGGGEGKEYFAGDGLRLNNAIFSIDRDTVAVKADLDSKQDLLTAGDNITIEKDEAGNTVISATGGAAGGVTSVNEKTGAVTLTGADIMLNEELVTPLDNVLIAMSDELGNKQHMLTEGEGIKIENNVISATAAKTWRELEIDRAQFDSIERGDQVASTIPAYDGTNFKNDYARIILNNTSVLSGSTIKVFSPFTNVYLNFVTDNWLESRTEKLLSRVNYDGFNFDYYKTLILFAGCEEGHTALEADNAFTGKNIIYVQDTSQQDWEKKYDEKIGDHRDGLAIEAWGQCYGLHIKGDTETFECIFVYQDTQQAYWNETDEILEWKNVEAGKIYKAHYDHDCGTGRWLLDVDLDGNPIAYTNDELQALLTTPINFEANKFAADTVVDTVNLIKASCSGLYESELFNIFSFNDLFAEPEIEYLEFIGRPNAVMNNSLEYYDEDGEFHIEEEGEYVWDIEVLGESISIIIPKTIPTTVLIQHRVENSGQVVVRTYPSINLYRHTCTIKNIYGVLPSDYKLSVTALIINAQIGDSSIDYLLHSDENSINMTTAGGTIGVPNGAGSYNYFAVTKLIADWVMPVGGDKVIRSLIFEYFDTNTGETLQTPVITDDNKKKYTCELFTNTIASVLTDNKTNVDVIKIKQTL